MSLAPTIDGDFTFPREIEGTQIISVDEVTSAITIIRKYAQTTATYTPSPPQSGNDYLFTTAVLISEAVENIIGPMSYFRRTYCTIPAPRNESRMVAFTRPGESAVVLSTISHLPIGWSAYGKCAPFSSLVVANVAFSYALGDDEFSPPNFTPPAETVITYSGVTGGNSPVDYIGAVYVQTGYAIVGFEGNNISEQRWRMQGQTNPNVIPNPWILNVNITRWKGPIWQMEVVSIPNVI
jgi:hypothetical protein